MGGESGRGRGMVQRYPEESGKLQRGATGMRSRRRSRVVLGVRGVFRDIWLMFGSRTSEDGLQSSNFIIDLRQPEPIVEKHKTYSKASARIRVRFVTIIV